MNDLDNRIRDTIATMVRDAPEPIGFGDLRVPRNTPAAPVSRRRNLATAAIALAVVAGIVVAVVALRSGSTTRRPAATDQPLPTHEVVEYTQTATAECPGGGAPIVQGRFDRMRFEAWADPVTRRYRMRVTYPDGSSRDVIAFGSPWYPTESFERGTVASRTLTCPTFGVFGSEPGQGAFWSLNPMADIPTRSGGVPMVMQYFDGGTRVAGAHRDSLGRTVDLWQQVTGGTRSAEGQPSYDLAQTQSWYVEPATGRVLERTWDDRTEGVSHVTYREVLVSADADPVPDSTFSTAGYRRLPVDASPGFNQPSTTTIGSAG